MLQNFYVFKDATSILTGAFIPNCTTNDGRKEAAIMHTITDLKHSQLIKYQYGAATPVDTTITRDAIMAAINTELQVGILPTHLEFSWDTDTHAITLTPKGGEATTGANDIDYSCCLFKGIDELDAQPDTFVFNKAKARDGSDTIVFKSIKGGTAKHYYDVSNDIP